MPKLDDTKSEDAASAARDEVAGKPVVVEFNGDTYTVDEDRAGSIEFFELQESGKFMLATSELLGPTQWAKFKAKNKRLSAVNDFYEALGKVSGSGNS